MAKPTKKVLDALRKGRAKLAKMRKQGKARRGKNKPVSTASLVRELTKRGYKVAKV